MRALTESELDSVAGGQPLVTLNAITAGLAGLAAGPGRNTVSIELLQVTAPGFALSIELLQVTAPGGLAFGALGAFLAPTTMGQIPSIEIFAF
jgi:hypothetical protein